MKKCSMQKKMESLRNCEAIVTKDQNKIDKYVEQIISKIKKDVDDYSDFVGYRTYCWDSCLDYPNDVNYHKAVEMIFGKLPEVVSKNISK